MINSHCKRKNFGGALKLYDSMLRSGISPDLIVYSIMIDCFFKDGKLEQGYHLLNESLVKGIKLDAVMFGMIMDSLVKVGDLGKLIEVHSRMLREGNSPTIGY